MNLQYPLILASNSPRRKQLLAQAGFEFTVQTFPVEENYPATMPVADIAGYLAAKKADAFQGNITNQLVLTADTTVLVDDDMFAKPANEAEAAAMLRRLSGRSHLVMTGICLMDQGVKTVQADTTEVVFRTLTEAEITHYVQTYKPYDKAGAYAIQEWIGMVGITKIVGSHFNVVGLPLHLVYAMLTPYMQQKH